MNSITPSAGPLAFISPVIEFAEPGDKLQMFVDQVRVVGILLRKGRFNSDSEMAERELWSIARANGLTGEPGSGRFEVIEDEIGRAVAIDEGEPRRATNGHDADDRPWSPDDYGAAPIRNDTPHAPRQIRFTKFSEIKLSTKARYLVKGIIPNVGLVVVWGEPKCGKSFTVFDMVAHIAAGWQYRDRRVKQCPVVYFALEARRVFSPE
jgi:AAA domain